MPAQDAYDAAHVRARLEPWFAERLGGPCRITGLTAPGASGFSSETMLVDIETAAGVDQVVVKTRPLGFTVFPHYDMRRQYRCMETVREFGIPVPAMRWYESGDEVLGREFYVMERVDGDVPTDNLPYTVDGFLHAATEDQQATLYRTSLDVLAALHSIPLAQVDLSFLDRPQYGAVGLDQQFGEYEEFVPFAMEGEPHPPIDEALVWLRANRPAAVGLGLSWGDSRIGNIMYRDFRPVAVLDWEMASMAPPELDLAWFLYFNRFFSEGIGLPELPGFPTASDGVAHYERAAGRTVGDLEYYLVWAGFRYAVIMVRLLHRMVAEDTLQYPDWTYLENPFVALMETVLDEARR